MAIEEQNTMSQPKRWWMLPASLLISVLYIGIIILSIYGALFSRSVSCLGSCGDFADVALESAYLMCGILILAIVEAIGLVMFQSWARMFGIVLGVSLLAPSFFEFYTIGTSFPLTLKYFFTGPFNILILFMIGYLSWSKRNTHWRDQGIRSIIIALLLSGASIGLVAVNMQNYHLIEKPYLDALRAEEQARYKGVVKAGDVYRNAPYGFELIFPVDKTMNSSDEKSITFSSYISPGDYHVESLIVKIENTHDGQDTLDGVMLYTQKVMPYTIMTRGVISNISYLKIDFDNVPENFEYVIVHNGKLFHFGNGGTTSSPRFDLIMQTLKFTK